MTVFTRDMLIKPYWKKYLEFDHTLHSQRNLQIHLIFLTDLVSKDKFVIVSKNLDTARNCCEKKAIQKMFSLIVDKLTLS